jgi:hypothetical protein
VKHFLHQALSVRQRITAQEMLGPAFRQNFDDISPGTIMNSRLTSAQHEVVLLRCDEQTGGGGRVVEGSRRWRPLNPGREASSLI